MDDITQNLSEVLKEFLGFFTNELQKKVLELDTNVKSKDYFQELTRVSNSLEQYVKKDVSLFYIGFLGSYSSGKTSTINSLLNLWGTDKERKVNNNPTDDCITLITNQANVNNVFTFAKEGAISIRTNTNFDSRFLDNIVLMDTPGSGDPNIIESIVRDSLPLCDLIIYALNATAPFTEIDRPFLLAQQSKLKNIPILFVLTRADEYIVNKLGKVSKTNFDIARSEEDLKTVINRINEAITISNFSERDFVFIDNKENFNIDLLIERVNEHTMNSDENLIALHNHKLGYFRNEIKNIHNYYLDLSASKIDKCAKFISKANDNIEYFEQQIEVSKMKFRALWNDNILTFSRIYDGTIKGYIESSVEELQKIKSLLESVNFTFHRSGIKEKLTEKSKQVSNEILRKIEEKAFNEITIVKNKIIGLVNFETLSVDNNFSFNDEFNYSIEFPLDKKEYAKTFKDLSKQKILEDSKILKDIFLRISRNLKQKTPLDVINNNIISYNSSSIEILNLYYDAIKMYNIVAFSYEVKSYISELGLAKELDELESNEINKPKYNLIAEKELLGDFKPASINFEEELNLAQTNSVNINAALDQLDLTFDFTVEVLDPPSEKEADLFKTSDISIFVTESYRILITNLQNNLVDLNKRIKALKRRRIYRYLIFSMVPFLIIISIWFGFKLRNITTPTSLLWTVLIGIGCSLIATLISSLTDRYKNKRYEKVDEFKKETMEKNENLISESFNLFKEKNREKNLEIAQRLREKWFAEENELLVELMKCPSTAIDTEIIEIKKRILILIDDYKNSYNRFNKKILSLFNNEIDSFNKIESVASKIKEDSIRPSFNLLQKTMEEIKTVKKEIELLDY